MIVCLLPLQERLTWVHAYQEQLEKLHALEALRCCEHSDAEILSRPQGLSALRYSKELSDAESAASAIEHKHAVAERWTVDSAHYHRTSVERKCYHVHRLQHKIVTDVDWLRWSTLAISRNPRQHRGTSTQMKKKARDARDRLHQTVQQLQEWHAVPGDIGQVGYDVASLSPDDMQQPDWKAPWNASGDFVSAQSQQVHHLQQLRQRCVEELQILGREADDMVEFYTKQQADLQAALQARCAGNAHAAVTHCPAHIIPVLSAASKAILEQQFNSGQQFILAGKLLRCQQLLARAEALALSLTTASVDTMQLAPLPPFQRHMDVSPLLSSEGDASNTFLAQAGAPSYGTADNDDDIDNDFAEFDLEDPSFTDVNDFADLFAAVSLDAELVG